MIRSLAGIATLGLLAITASSSALAQEQFPFKSLAELEAYLQTPIPSGAVRERELEVLHRLARRYSEFESGTMELAPGHRRFSTQLDKIKDELARSDLGSDTTRLQVLRKGLSRLQRQLRDLEENSRREPLIAKLIHRLTFGTRSKDAGVPLWERQQLVRNVEATYAPSFHMICGTGRDRTGQELSRRLREEFDRLVAENPSPWLHMIKANLSEPQFCVAMALAKAGHPEISALTSTLIRSGSAQAVEVGLACAEIRPTPQAVQMAFSRWMQYTPREDSIEDRYERLLANVLISGGADTAKLFAGVWHELPKPRRIAVLGILAGIEKPLAQELITQETYSKDVEIRSAACTALIYLVNVDLDENYEPKFSGRNVNETAAVRRILEFASDPSEEIRNSVESLSLEWLSLDGPFIRSLLQGRNRDHRLLVARAVSDPAYTKYAMFFLDDEDPTVQESFEYALRNSEKALMALARSSDLTFREFAAENCYQYPEVASLLMRDRAESVRVRVLKSATPNFVEENFDEVSAALSDESVTVRLQAAELLAKSLEERGVAAIRQAAARAKSSEERDELLVHQKELERAVGIYRTMFPDLPLKS